VQGKVVLITGGARRVGAAICRRLHAAGASLMLHYRNSAGEARLLQAELNHVRPNSVALIQADLLDLAKLPSLVEQTIQTYGRLDGPRSTTPRRSSRRPSATSRARTSTT
jgi:pteridine reductase